MTSSNAVLRAVGDGSVPGEVVPPPEPMTLSEAIDSGSYLEILKAQRRDIVNALPDTKGPALAAMHRQLSLTSKEIEALESKDADESGGGANVEDGEFNAEAI